MTYETKRFWLASNISTLRSQNMIFRPLDRQSYNPLILQPTKISLTYQDEKSILAYQRFRDYITPPGKILRTKQNINQNRDFNLVENKKQRETRVSNNLSLSIYIHIYVIPKNQGGKLKCMRESYTIKKASGPKDFSAKFHLICSR